MPRKIIDYSKTVMYKIVCNDLTIKDGHTTEYTKRKNVHKYDCTNNNGKHNNYKVYQFIRENGSWENWSMILIEKYPCNDSLEATQRERYWCEQLNATLNSYVPSRTSPEYYKANVLKIKQYREENVDKIKQQRKLYRSKNVQKIADRKKRYSEQNIEKIQRYANAVIHCQCGCSYTRANKHGHLKSNKHQFYEKNRLYYLIRDGLDLIGKIDKQILCKHTEFTI